MARQYRPRSDELAAALPVVDVQWKSRVLNWQLVDQVGCFGGHWAYRTASSQLKVIGCGAL